LPVTERAGECLLRLPLWVGLEPKLDEGIDGVRAPVRGENLGFLMPVEPRSQVGPAEAHVAARIAAKVLVATVLFAISLPAFYQQTLGTGGSDIPTHFGIARDTQVYPYAPYSILSAFVGGLFWAGANSLAVGWVAIVLLSACV